MLVVAKVRAGGERYYLEATPGPGRRGVELPGRWAGSAAAALGLAGMVGDSELTHVMAGRHPGGGDALGGARSRVKVCGFDLTFAAPKSVSILHGLADADVADTVRIAHERAVAAAMGYVEGRAVAVRRRVDGGKAVPVPSATVAAQFVHLTSRALDPHLHSHVVLANLGRASDSSWSALDARGVYAHRAAADSLYHSQLRHELTSVLGVRWGRLDHGRADIAGIGSEARSAFSSRSRQIALNLEAHGFPTAGGDPPRRASEMAALVTRADRRLDVDMEELRPLWRRRAQEVGLGPRQLDRIVGQVQGLGARRGDDERGSRSQDVYELAELVESTIGARSFARRQVVRAAASRHRAGAPSQAVEKEVDRFMALTQPAPGAADYGRNDLCGVAEPRRVAPELLRHRDIEALLARRGLSVEHDLGHDRGVDLGLG